jgi:hypothetical protein
MYSRATFVSHTVHSATLDNYSLVNKLKAYCMQWRSWLRHCAANLKVASSIPDVLREFFIDIIPSAAL